VARKKRGGRIAAPSRPYWSGTIRLSLVALPVNVFKGVDQKADFHFHQLHKPSGKRIQYQKVAAGEGPVDTADIVKGYEYAKGKYIVVEPEELKSLRIESNSSFTIVRFVDRNDIDAIYFDEPHFVAPADEAAVESFAVVRDALRAARKIGLGQIVLSGRERIAALGPCGDGLLLETLRYEDDLKDAKKFFAPAKGVKADRDQLELARRLIEQKSGAFEPDAFKDHYEQAVREMLDAKRKHKEVVTAEPPVRRSAEVIDLMDALRRSVKGEKRETAAPERRAPRRPEAPERRAPRRRAAGRRR
jgi:DNA end-binding protein Ku